MQTPYGNVGPSPHPLSRDTSSGGTNVFVYGILGIMLCQILAPVAWLKGNEYVRTCRALGVEPSGLGVAGRVLGIVGTFLAAVSVIALVVGLALQPH